MLRKMVIALASSAALALAMAPTDASARHGGGFAHGGFAHGGVRGFAGVHRFGFHRFAFHDRVFFRHHRRFFFAGGYPYYGCYRWVPGPWGWHRAWVCNNIY
jgi:hypothetical protein